MMKVKVAAVQPEAHWGEEEWRNAERALKYVDEAAATGAKLITFSEGYPGPSHGPLDSGGRLSCRPMDAMRDKAREHRVYIAASDLEPNPAIPETYFLTLKLIAPSGQILANYRRVQPDHQYLNAYLHGGRRHVLPGEELMVVPTELGNIGLLICSELFCPELARIEMLMGAQIIIAPVNGQHSRTRPRLSETWRCVARARAAENLLYVVCTQNIFQSGAQGVGIIAGPEEAIAVSPDPGVIVGELDLERIAWYRTRYYNPEFFVPPDDERFITRCRPGQIHDRRPELYGRLTQPQEDAFDYHYSRRGLEAWQEEFEKVKRYALPRLSQAPEAVASQPPMPQRPR
ncbi:MAG: carbon-nitrogen hydrolase family protein [Deltaproteobacteria bacterium]|nr:carbon-nitrogen hydrolase family protein [Deltaproteobacteria bacterium]